MSFPDRLKKARGETSQKLFAEMVGVHNSTFSRWERGEQFPSQPDICKILQIRPLINPTWFLTGEGPIERCADQPHSCVTNLADHSLLEAVIAAVEEHLAAIKGKLPPAKKAQLIITLYDLFASKEDKKVDKAVVISLFKLAA